MTFVIGLTGSIGMGKSTTAAMFAQRGIPVWDADAAVRELYQPGGAAVEPIRKIAPKAVSNKGVDREALREEISQDETILDHLNAIVHPLVAEHRERFLTDHQDKIVLLDVPLLFEGGLDQDCDFVVVVSAPTDIQKQRVLARNQMTEDEFAIILDRQLPDAEKRQRADRVIETLTIEHTEKAVDDLLTELKESHQNA